MDFSTLRYKPFALRYGARFGSHDAREDKRRSEGALAACVCFLWLTFALHVAHAQPSDTQLLEARRHGRDALELMRREDFAGAERALTEALALHAAPTLLLKRGQARERQGKLLGAASDYRAAAQFAAEAPAGEHPKYKEAREAAQARFDVLVSRIPHLTLSAQGRIVRLTVNGVAWPVEALPLSRSIDPGVYAIEVIDGDGVTDRARVELAVGEHKTLTLQGSGQTVAAVGEVSSTDRTRVAAPARIRVADAGTDTTFRYSLGAVTLALAAAAAITGIVALERRADYHEHNRADVAMGEKLRLRSDASRWGWISTALTGVAVAGTASFVYVTYLAPESHSGLGGLQLTTTGRF